MNAVEPRPLAAAVLSWVDEVGSQDAEQSYAAGIGRGLLIGLALARIDPACAGAALDELVQAHHDRLAASLADTPMPPPPVEMHRLMVFAQARGQLRRCAPDRAG